MKLSIITVNFNNKDGLQKTIDSVICQTWKDYEWIIIDGGSTDGSKELIEQYQEHFAYWCSELDQGVYNAMNKGISRAKGDYLNFLNSGDCFHNPDVLSNIFQRKISEDIIYGNLNYVFKDKSFVDKYPSQLSFHYFLYLSIGHPASFIRSTLLKDGYREDFKIISDWYKFLEWFREGRTFYHVDAVISDFDTAGMSSKNIDIIKKEKEKAFDELFSPANRRLIEESIFLQKEHDEMKSLGLIQLKEYGGIRFSLWLRLTNFLVKTIRKNKS